MSYRTCAACDRHLHSEQYTNNQWSKGPGWSRCITCVYGYQSDLPYANALGRFRAPKQFRAATFMTDALRNPFAQGIFRWVAKGLYTSGARKGQPCVCKWFKSGTVMEETFFEHDILAVDKALEIVDKFYNIGIVSKLVKINVPEVWTFDDAVDDEWAGTNNLQEPFIQNYQHFNSNTGWNNDSTRWPRATQALSHFSYHACGGQYVLCDLQGGIYRDFIVLSDPVVLSRRREFGVTGLGPASISSFFSQHECNEYYRPIWTQPADQRQNLRPTVGTTMAERRVPTRYSRPANTYAYW